MWDTACAFCGGPGDGDGSGLGRLLGPVGDTDYYVHRPCALWSPEVHESESGTLLRVLEAVRRGRQLKCMHCGRRGASVGCRVERCKHSMHALCAARAGATFYANHCVACPEHARRFPKDAIHQQPLVGGAEAVAEDGAGPAGASPARGDELVSPSPDRRNGDTGEAPPAKRQRLEEARRRTERAKAVIKHARREQRRATVQDSDDEGHFRNREAARLQRDIARLNPLTLGGGGPSGGHHAVQHVYIKPPKATSKTALPEVAAAADTAAVGAVLGADLSSLAGQERVVRQLREMVLLPLLYPEMFSGLGVAPPRGILFHGPPGTGKTLAARALAGACARHSPVPVTFFARKGADCLGKFVGEAERTLRLLFQEAARRAPAVIFLDEIDALVPSRAATSGAQDQIHASVVSTLLSLMDGLTGRANVVVLAATNRPEAIDAALRRPGRFDREVYFGLPTPAQRCAILRAHTARWAQAPGVAQLAKVAASTEGFAGADLAALCTAAVMAAARRAAPALLELHEAKAAGVAAGCGQQEGDRPEGRQLGDQADGVQRGEVATPAAAELGAQRHQALDAVAVEAGDWEEALASAPAPCSRRDGLAGLVVGAARPLQHHIAPLLLRQLQRLLAALGDGAVLLPPAAAAVAEAAQRGPLALLEVELARLGAVGPPAGSAAAPLEPAEPAAVGDGEAAQSGLQLALHPPCRLLVAGVNEGGQELVVGAALRLLEGCPVHVVSLTTLMVEGEGDAAAGCAAVVAQALRRADRAAPCVFYLPRVETWAVIKTTEAAEEGPAARVAGSPPRGRSAAAAGGAPKHAFAAAPSPFDGLVSLERRKVATPAAATRPAASVPCGSSPARGQKGALSEVVIELSRLSDAWSVFESMMRQAPPSQPILLLATCHSKLESLPENLLAFFGPPGAAVHLSEPTTEEWGEAVGRARRATATAVAARAATALLEHLQPLQPLGTDPAAPTAASGTAAASEASVCGVPSPAVERQPPPEFNAADMDRGRALYAQTMRFVNELGRRLLRDKRCHAAHAAVHRQQRASGEQHCSFAEVAHRAATSEYGSLDELRAAAAAAAATLGAAAEQERNSSEADLRYPGAAALAHALHDEIDARCHALWQELGLADPRTAHLVAAVQREVAGLVQQRQQQQQRQQRCHPGAAAETTSGCDLSGVAAAGSGDAPGSQAFEEAEAAARHGAPPVAAAADKGGSGGHVDACGASWQGAEGADPAALLGVAAQLPTQDRGRREAAALAASFRCELERLLLGEGALRPHFGAAPPSGSPAVESMQRTLAAVVARAGEACGVALAAEATDGKAGDDAQLLAQLCSGAVHEVLARPWVQREDKAAAPGADATIMYSTAT